ncbi:hypothetical protein Tco_1069542 [Tanacetum coccineum]|uniref:Uncharacterized protein n=1 Tax=Tanacetum coccineum TaxID=301880 RepID=A0ABQ5HKS1_9ASTR
MPADASPTANSPGYIADSEPFEDNFEEDPEMDPFDYADDDEEEEDEESSDDEEHEDGHLAPADSALPVPDYVPSSEETEPFETDESTATPPPTRSPQTIYDAAPIPLSPPPSPLSPLSPPLLLIPSPPLPLPSPPLLLPSPTHRDAIPEADMPPQKRTCFTAPSHRFEIGESFATDAPRHTGSALTRGIDYGFIDTLDASLRVTKERVMTTLEGVNERMADLATTHRQDVEEFYMRHQDAQDDQSETLEAQVRTLQTQHDRMEWQRQEAGDMVTRAYGRIHALEARDPAHPDDMEDAGSSC